MNTHNLSDNGHSLSLCIAVAGDSTVCDQPLDSSCRGWGQYLHEYFLKSVRIVNLAYSGCSTKTFITQGRWDKVLCEKPDFVLIQFGHNDSHAPELPESTDATVEYPANLERYIEEARAIGATPVLITPMHRRIFDADGQLDDNLQPYADAMKTVAVEKAVALIDLHTLSGELLCEWGETASKEMANEEGDRTHFNEYGARMMLDLVMREWIRLEPRLQSYLVELLSLEMLQSTRPQLFVA
jgi:lysophospholipase L1-like esterase